MLDATGRKISGCCRTLIGDGHSVVVADAAVVVVGVDAELTLLLHVRRT